MEPWAAAGGSANDLYLANRLQYHDALRKEDETFLKGAGSTWRALLAILLWGTVLSMLLAIPLTIVAQMMQTDQSKTEASPLQVLALAGYVIAALWPRREAISQWELLLDGKADAAESAYATILLTLRARKIPGRFNMRRIRSSTVGSVRNYITVERNRYTVYVSVFPFGTGLFMTWSMWRTMNPVSIIWAGLCDTASSLLFMHTQFHRVIRSDPDRALREAVHNATREGVEAAVSGLQVQTDTILNSIPIELETEELATPPVQPGYSNSGR